MRRFRWLFMLAFVGLAVCSMGTFTSEVYAQNGPGTDSAGVKNNDKAIAQRQGVSESLASDKPMTTATPTEAAIGVGSIFVMIIVMKYL